MAIPNDTLYFTPSDKIGRNYTPTCVNFTVRDVSNPKSLGQRSKSQNKSSLAPLRTSPSVPSNNSANDVVSRRSASTAPSKSILTSFPKPLQVVEPSRRHIRGGAIRFDSTSGNPLSASTDNAEVDLIEWFPRHQPLSIRSLESRPELSPRSQEMIKARYQQKY